jgi:Protein of unknown function (DUF2971)
MTPTDIRSHFGTGRGPEPAELRGTATDHLYHYTGPDAAIAGILMSQTLRLSPYESTNDLWESRPFSPHLSVHEDDAGWIEEPGADRDLWAEIDRTLRLHTKVARLTSDFALPDYASNRNARRGWAHLALWSHYGGGHTGVCLRFDRAALIRAFAERAAPGALAFHGPVHYFGGEDTPTLNGVDVGQIREFGVDAVARIYAENNREPLFFSKDQDWSNEEEYRLVLLDDSTLPARIDIREALTGIVLGEAFPANRLPALREVLENFPDLEIRQARHANRRLVCLSTNLDELDRTAARGLPQMTPRRSGDLSMRTTALREAEAEATQLRAKAEEVAAVHAAVIEGVMAAIAEELGIRSAAQVTVRSRTLAVPPGQRSRKPGVSGERVHLERGALCAIEYVPSRSRTLWTAAAVQALDGDMLRLHAVVTVEHSIPGGNDPREFWRDARTVPACEAEAELDELLGRMRSAFDEARADLEADLTDR